MTSPSLSLGECPTQQARNAGVPLPPVHVPPNAAAGPLEGSSGQQDPDSSGRCPSQLLSDFLGGPHEGSPDQLSPDDSSSGTRRPAPVQQRPRSSRPEAALSGFRYLEVVGFCFLTFNNTLAIYRSWGDAGEISFAVCSYLTMLSLFFTIKKFQAMPPNSRRRKELMVCIWMFTMSLTIGFVYQIISTTAKPTLHLALLLWAIPAGTGISVFIIFSDRSGAHLNEEYLDV